MKKVILIILLAAAVALGAILAFNKTFFGNYYEITNDSGEEARIFTLNFSFYAGESEPHTAIFYRFGSRKSMQDRLNRFVENLTSCYDDGAFCDTEQDYTIYSYTVSDGFLIHKITLKYDNFDLKDIENATGKDLTTIILDGQSIDLKPGDKYSCAKSDAGNSSLLNGSVYNAPAITGRGITAGDSFKTVVSAYNITAGYAAWNITPESSVEKDETAEFTGSYSAETADAAELTVVYRKEEAQWYPVAFNDLDEYLPSDNGSSGEILLIYKFIFSGSDNLSGYSAEYYSAE